MPLYEYKCNKCGKVSEILVSSYENNAPICAYCKSDDVIKLISAANVGGSSGSCEIGGECPAGGSCDMNSGGGCCGK